MGCSSSKSDAIDTTNTVPAKNGIQNNGLLLNSPDHEEFNDSYQLMITNTQEIPSHLKDAPEGHTDKYGNSVDSKGGRIWSAGYYAARKEADYHVVQRGKCFQEAKKAFDENRKKEAKSLSEQGKRHGIQMEEANARAVKEIIDPQNLDNENANKIDLHGLLVSEAIDNTKLFVLKSIGKKESIEVVTGQGIHSNPSKGPVIKPAIIKLCNEKGWKYEQVVGNDGTLIIFIPNSQL